MCYKENLSKIIRDCNFLLILKSYENPKSAHEPQTEVWYQNIAVRFQNGVINDRLHPLKTRLKYEEKSLARTQEAYVGLLYLFFIFHPPNSNDL